MQSFLDVALQIYDFSGKVILFVWNTNLLFVGYSILWFLTGALMFFVRGPNATMKGSVAMVLGIFSTILHLIACHFFARPCRFW
jgi:hypothetical protein